jgi:hypothetical protein
MINVSTQSKTNDLGMDKLIREIRRDAVSVDIGIHEGDSQDVIDRATQNEFGTSTIPERSFIRSTIDENAERYAKASEILIGLMIDGEISKFEALERMGQQIEKDIKEKITNLKSPANSLRTIEAKGSDNPLIDTGEMRASIRYLVKSEANRILGGD